MKYNGNNWVVVGTPGISDSTARYTSIAIDSSGTPYIVYQDWGNRIKATVMKYNGSSWIATGSAGLSDSVADYTSIAIDRSGTPYVVYDDIAYGQRATVMKFGFPNYVQNVNDLTTFLTVFPNPNQGTFTFYISCSVKQESTIVITNMIGQVVKTLVVPTNTDTEIQLDVPDGVYILSAKSRSGTLCTKINVVE